MGDRLFVGLLGRQEAGKSTTWDTLFGHKTRTGSSSRSLYLNRKEKVDVFLVSGSFEERRKYAGDVLENQECRIVLCSIQYTEAVLKSLGYFIESGFDMYVQWLNPGYKKDTAAYFDELGLVNHLLANKAVLAMRNAKKPIRPRVRELSEFIYGWAQSRGLILPV